MNATTALPPVGLSSREQRRQPLDLFFAPETIAVIGASPRENSVGRSLIENLYEYRGRVFPVNPKYAEILRLPAFPAIGEVPAKIDLAIIATPADVVAEVMQECGAAGVRAAIVLSAGFKECGPAGVTREQHVQQIARQAGIRVIGPNCLGLMLPRIGLNATFATTMARPGNVAFISQSGALCSAVLDWSLRENVGFSAFVSVGSMLDIGWAELLDWLGDDPHTHSIILYMESVGDARAFMSAAREVAFNKPIIVLKVGRTEAAARAAASHTGALAGRDEVLDAAFRRAGVLRVDTIEDLFDMAEVLAKQPRPRGPRLAIVTNAGGPGALAVDRLIAAGGELAPLAPETRAKLDRLLPPHWSHGNPIDILGDADARRYAKTIEIAVADPTTDGLLVVLTPQAMSDPLATAAALKALQSPQSTKPILASWMGGTAVAAGQTLLNEAGIPTFRYPDRAAQAFDYMGRYSANVAALYETPTLFEPERHEAELHQTAEILIRNARERRRLLLTETESKQVLAAYGIPVVSAFPATTEDEAVAVAARMNFPVALKLHSETITHKAAVGGVRLNVRSEAEVRGAWRSIKRSVGETVGEHHFLGVTVERMISADGDEFILGSTIDAQFGPVILFGAGGRLVEVVQDRALGLPPLTSTLARRLMEQTKLYRAVAARRGAAAVDLAALERVVVRFSQLVAEQRWLKEIDVNPLFVSANQIVALDARMILHDLKVTEHDLPKPAIRPYPREYASTWDLADGTTLQLRPIRAEDEPLMARFHTGLSDRTVYYRYFGAVPLTQRVDHARLARLCFVDYDRELALVVVRRAFADEKPEIVAVGRLCKAHGRNEAEFAVVVADRWQRRGIGSHLLGRLVQIARQEKLVRLTGPILWQNAEMRRVCERNGFSISAARDGECIARLAL